MDTNCNAVSGSSVCIRVTGHGGKHKYEEKKCKHVVAVHNGTENKFCVACGKELGQTFSAQKAIEYIRDRFQAMIFEYDELKSKFITDAGKDPRYAIEVLSGRLVVQQFLATIATDALASYQEKPLEEAMALVSAHCQRLTAEVLRDQDGGCSTNPFANEVSRAERVAKVKFVEFFKGWIEGTFRYYKEDAALPRQ